MKAKAPGKVVLSGAYSVLEGAPAIVSAVDRYAIADDELAPDWVTPEVQAALGERGAPHADASALRAGAQKLGLGSSAAILVASLAVSSGEAELTPEALRELEQRARAAHQKAQGGGSGIDVAAAVWGGTLLCRRHADGALDVEAIELPRELSIEVWWSGAAASTSALLASVRRLAQQEPELHAAIMGALKAAADRAARAIGAVDADRFIAALAAQGQGLKELGDAAGEPIVTPELAALAHSATAEGAALLPSGAGGGDISVWVARRPSSEAFQRLAASLGQHHLPLRLHARGVHRSR
jgi:phosphomevalonate kinase